MVVAESILARGPRLYSKNPLRRLRDGGQVIGGLRHNRRGTHVGGRRGSEFCVQPMRALHSASAGPGSPAAQRRALSDALCSTRDWSHCLPTFRARRWRMPTPVSVSRADQYIALVPSTLRSGHSEGVSISLLKEGDLATGLVRLALLEGDRPVAEVSGIINGSGMLSLPVPHLPAGQYPAWRSRARRCQRQRFRETGAGYDGPSGDGQTHLQARSDHPHPDDRRWDTMSQALACRGHSRGTGCQGHQGPTRRPRLPTTSVWPSVELPLSTEREPRRVEGDGGAQ